MTPFDCYLSKRNLTDQQVAAEMTARGCRATPGWIRQIRRGIKRPGSKLAIAIVAWSQGEGGLTLDDLLAPNIHAPADATAAAATGTDGR